MPVSLDDLQLPPGFELCQLVYESERTVVVRARTASGETRILKVLRSSCPRPRDVVAYKREFELTRRTRRNHIVRATDLVILGRRPVLVMEDIGGTSLDRLLARGDLSLVDRLELAVQIAKSISEIHAENVIHKDINPSNIVVDEPRRHVVIIDFAIATNLSRERPPMKSPSVLEGTLPYVSPEQTGRMNRVLDCRSDLYSFGVTLYELFTGKLPFTGDALALVHQHLTRPPAPMHEVDAAIPRALSEVVAKLLAKTPEERYQSACGVMADLEECLARLRSHDDSPFVPGRHDVRQQLHLSQRLYGRDAELEELLAAFDRACAGSRELVLLAGYSGIGKTSLVQELFRPLTRHRGWFITGKFDQVQRKMPYGAFAMALRDFVRQLLAESDGTLQSWRERLTRALGANGQLLVDVIPELALVIGPQPPVPDLAPLEARNRFTLVFEAFVRELCAGDQPFVVFLDDLQWSDDATLGLIELLTSEATGQLLLIGAYRDNEIGPEHPLESLRRNLARRSARFQTITLPPLGLCDLAALLRDTFDRDLDATLPLARVVQAKTGGNPFFVGQFVTALCDEGLVHFSFGDRGSRPSWRWSMTDIARTEITDNVVELMVRRLRKLPDEALTMLELAACIGAKFDLPTLSLVAHRPHAVTYAALFPALQEGVIVPTRELELLEADLGGPIGFLQCAFLHDRVQQAAYGMIDEERRAQLHLELGRLLLARLDEEKRSERLFEIVDHLDVGRALVTDRNERIALARLDLQAARRAQLATAYDAALRYVENAMTAFPGDWAQEYALTLELHRERAELEYLNGHHARAEALIDEVWTHAADLDRAATYAQLVTQHTLLGKNEEAIAAAARALELVGVRFPSADELDAATDVALAAIAQALEGRSIASLVDLPAMVDPRVKVAMKLLMTVHTAVFFANRYRIYSWVLATMTQLSIEYGNVPESAKGYASFGNTLAARHGRYEQGFELGMLGRTLAQRYGDDGLRCKTCLILSMFLNHWVRPIAAAEVFDEEGRRAGMAAGELQFVGYILFYGRVANRFHAGEPLDDLVSEIRAHLAFSRKVDHRLSTDNLRGALLVTGNLVGMTKTASSFDLDGQLTEAEYLRQCAENGTFPAICFYLTTKAFALYLHGDVTGARAAIELAAPLVGYIKGVLTEAAHVFYDALIVAAECTSAGPERAALEARLARDLERLEVWARHCPANFLHQHRIVAAEVARLGGDRARAEALYDEAIAAAQEHGFTQDRALAHELAARLLLAEGEDERAQAHLGCALSCLVAWGAKRKQGLLLASYPELAERRAPASRPEPASGRSTPSFFTERTLSATLDLASVIKACQAISREIDLDALLDRLLGVLIESAGAGRAVVLVQREGQLRLAADVRVGERHATMLGEAPFESTTDLPRSVVQYVARTRATVVLRDASREGMFTSDPYVQAEAARSVLCVPVLFSGQLSGVLYLENNEIAGTFSPDRVELLEILAAQAAIALENARLFRQSQEAVRIREDFLMIASHELRTPITPIKMQNEIVKRLVERSPELPNRAALLAAIDRSGGRLGKLERLIDNLLDMSNVASGGLVLHRERFELADLVRKVVDDYAASSKAAGCTVAVQAEAPVTGAWDRTRVEQVVVNLLTNAMKYGASRPIEVSVAADSTHGTDDAVIVVRDYGIGIAKDDQLRIGNRFTRAASARHYGGLGLGLYITREIVQAHGGTLRVESEPGEGAAFIVSLPREAPPSACVLDTGVPGSSSERPCEAASRSSPSSRQGLASSPRSPSRGTKRTRAEGSSRAVPTSPRSRSSKH